MAIDLTPPPEMQGEAQRVVDENALKVPDVEETKALVEQQLSVSNSYAAQIDSAAAESGAQIMKVDLDSIEDRRAITRAVEDLGSDLVRQSTTKNEMLSRRMVELGKAGSEGSEVANGLEDLAIKMKELDPSLVDFAKTGFFAKIFDPVQRYFNRYKTADGEIAAIVKSLDRGREALRNDNVTLELEEDSMRDLTKQLNEQIEMARDLDTYLSNAVTQAKAAGEVDEERIKFVEEEVIFPLRQKIMDFQQLLVVNQQGIVSMNVIRRNNLELIRAVDRAESVTVSALRVAVTVAGALYNQRIVLDKVKALNETTNAMITSTSRMLQEQSTEIHTQAVEANISTDTLKEAFGNTIKALEDISNYKQEALPKIAATIAEFQELADEGQKYLDRIEERDAGIASMNSGVRAAELQEAATIEGAQAAE